MYEQGSFSWFASLAGAARVALRTQQLNKAIIQYETLLQYDINNEMQHFPEARLGLACAFTALGFKEACAGQIEEALAHLHHSLQLYDEAKQDNPAQKMIQEASSLITSAQHYQSITEILRFLTNNSSLDSKLRRELIITQLSFSKENYQKYCMMHSSQRPIDAQKCFLQSVADGCIALELGLGLIDENLLQKQFIEIDLPAMRERIRQSMGVIVPGIQVRDNLDLPYNDYQIVFYNGLRTRNTISSFHTMLDAYNAILSHLEVFLGEHLDILLGVQEIQETLDEWKRERGEERPILIREALPDDLAVARLAQVLRGLVKERQSIVDLESILKAFKSTRSLEISDIIKHVRGML